MEIRKTCQHPQSFGMAIKSNETVNEILLKRITNIGVRNEIAEIINKQAKNTLVETRLLADEKGHLCANIFEIERGPLALQLRHVKETFFDRLSGNPLRFFRRINKNMNEMTQQIESRVDSSDILDKMI